MVGGLAQAQVGGSREDMGQHGALGKQRQERETEKKVVVREASHFLEFSALCRKWGLGRAGLSSLHFPQ